MKTRRLVAFASTGMVAVALAAGLCLGGCQSNESCKVKSDSEHPKSGEHPKSAEHPKSGEHPKGSTPNH